MTVQFFGSVLEHVSELKSVEITGATDIRALIDRLGERFGAGFRDFLLADESCLFLVNGGGILSTGGLSTPLNPGDTIEILPFVDGG